MTTKMADATDVKSSLSEIGLSKREIAVYTTLANGEEFTITQLSKKTGIPRSSVYRICSRLSKKKLINNNVGSKGKKVKIADSKKFELLVEKKKNEIKLYKTALKHIDNFTKNIPKTTPNTQIRHFRGVSGMKQLIWNTLKAKDEIVGYSVFGRVNIIGDLFTKKYNAEALHLGISDRVIINKKALPEVKQIFKDTIQSKYQNIRLISDKMFYVSGDTYIYNNIYAVNFWNQNEVVGVEIQNEEIAKVQRGIFKMLWEQGEKLKF